LRSLLAVSLRRAWDKHAENWIRWARTPGHDSFQQFHGARFFELVPPPGRLTLDIGAGEGRVARALRARGHRVFEIDGSPHMATSSAELGGIGVVADAQRLPVRTGAADCAIAFMSLQDVDDMPSAVSEAARVLEPGGCFVFAIVHPINSAGQFAPGPDEMARPFVMDPGPYFEERYYADDIERDGLTMRFESIHRPLESYSRALEAAGFVVDAMREVSDVEGKWTRMPLFLDICARQSARA
jgi:SAM-dependent methyltransferase